MKIIKSDQLDDFTDKAMRRLDKQLYEIKYLAFRRQ